MIQTVAKIWHLTPCRATNSGVEPEHLLEAIEQMLPSFHGKKYNIAEIYRACIKRGHLRREKVAPNTFRRHVQRFDLLKPVSDATPKRRLAFAKAPRWAAVMRSSVRGL